MLMSLVTVFAAILLFVVCSGNASTSAPVKKVYRGECAVDDDCENVFICNSGMCTCSYAQIISSDEQTCLDAVVYGDPCNESAQCIAHVEHSTCGAESTCQCELGFRYADTWGDHSCLPGSGSSSAPVSVWRVILCCVLSFLMRASTR